MIRKLGGSLTSAAKSPETESSKAEISERTMLDRKHTRFDGVM
jgi:hypothetical protein